LITRLTLRHAQMPYVDKYGVNYVHQKSYPEIIPTIPENHTRSAKNRMGVTGIK